MSDVIYLDHQASAPLGDGVLELMLPIFEGNPANPHSNHHQLGLDSHRIIETSRHKISNLLNADPNEIYFTSGATEANNLAILGSIEYFNTDNGVLVSSIEHKCVLEAARHRNRRKENYPTIPVDTVGEIDIQAFKKILQKQKPTLVSIMLANNEIGSIQNIALLSQVSHDHGALFHCDAAQGITHQSIDVIDLDIDFLSLSAHKMNGPKGIGALYVSRYARDKIGPIAFGGGQEGGLRSGTLPTALCAGFGKASENWLLHGDTYREQTKELRDLFWQGLKKAVPSARLIGPPLSERHNTNLNVHFPDTDAEFLLSQIQDKVAASTGSACTSGTPEPSHVISAIGDKVALNDGTVRFSFGADLSFKQSDYAISVISETLKRYA